MTLAKTHSCPLDSVAIDRAASYLYHEQQTFPAFGV